MTRLAQRSTWLWLLVLPGLAACSEARGSSPSGAGASSAAGGNGPGAGGGAGQTTGAAGTAAAAGSEAVAGSAPSCAASIEPNAWASWPLPDPSTKTGATAQQYTLTDEVATDRVTGLAWQRQPSPQPTTWQEARDYCDCLSLAGHQDWTLPSRIELVSIVDETRQNPAIDPEAFPATPKEWFWSASPATGQDSRYWYVGFFDGDTHAADSDQLYWSRCVRRSPGLTPRYDLGLEGTARDSATGLTWQRTASADRATWDDAALACTALDLQGNGWRLPSMKELQSLIDESRAAPAIDPDAFPDTASEGYWAATPLADVDASAWFVSFSEGIAYNAVKQHPYRFRCVR